MKQLFSIPANGYLLWSITRNISRKHCPSQYRTHFSAFKAVQEIQKNMYNRKPVLDSKKPKNTHLGKRFSSNQDQSLTLMNFDVWMFPNFFQMPRDLYYYFVMKRDLSFSETEFVSCSSGALQVVTTLLSQLRFPELKGLLTPDCQEELQQNLKTWTESDASLLSFDPAHLMTNIPCEFQVFSDEKDRRKKFAEIRMIHHVWLDYNPRCTKVKHHTTLNHFPPKNNGKWRMAAVYNCKFIREVTSGIDDQWTINKINLKIFPHLIHKF